MTWQVQFFSYSRSPKISIVRNQNQTIFEQFRNVIIIYKCPSHESFSWGISLFKSHFSSVLILLFPMKTSYSKNAPVSSTGSIQCFLSCLVWITTLSEPHMILFPFLPIFEYFLFRFCFWVVDEWEAKSLGISWQLRSTMLLVWETVCEIFQSVLVMTTVLANF